MVIRNLLVHGLYGYPPTCQLLLFQNCSSGHGHTVLLLTTMHNQIMECTCFGECSNGVVLVLPKRLGLEGNFIFSMICGGKESLPIYLVLVFCFLFGYYMFVISGSWASLAPVLWYIENKDFIPQTSWLIDKPLFSYFCCLVLALFNSFRVFKHIVKCVYSFLSKTKSSIYFI